MRIRFSARLAGLFLFLALGGSVLAQVPQVLNYQGRVAVGGASFNGTGQFRFALVDGTGATSYWSNDGTSTAGSAPTASVPLTVVNGLYSVLLGDTTLASMTPVPNSVFANSDVRLRVWFDDGTHGSQLLAPDQRIAAVGYALMAGGVADGAITGAKIAAGAVTIAQLGLGKITGFVTCNLTDPTHTYVYIRGTGSLVYVGDVTANGYPFQITLLEPGTYTVVAHISNGFETSASVTVAAGQTVASVNISATNLTNDLNNCGACGSVCSPTNATGGCVGGTCVVSACNTGFGNCDGIANNGCETNLQTSLANCGTCGNACNPNLPHVSGVGCAAGACVVAGCAAGYGDCNGVMADGCETNLLTTAANCGACGNACNFANSSGSCTNGNCVLGACNTGFKNCDGNPNNGCETNIKTDPANCGNCGIVCNFANGSGACTNGACALASCNAGYANCDGNPNNGCETNLMTDVNNCGYGCGQFKCSNTVLHATPSCISGVCGIASCNAGYGDCDGQGYNGCETPLNTTSNCGACGINPGNHATATCTGPPSNMVPAIVSCNAGYGDCDHSPNNGCETNLQTSPANCGGCGMVCSSNNITTVACSAGVCTGACNAGWGDCNGNKLIDGCETSLTTDTNCGACGNACTGGTHCNGSGVCQ